MGSLASPPVLVLALLASGCQPDLPEVSWTGKIIRFGATHPEDVCGDTLEWMDERAVKLAEMFGPQARSSIDFYWLDDLSPWCASPDVAGCAGHGEVNSLYVPHEHEVVHALRKDGLPAVFEEGLATMYGDIGWTGSPAPRERLVEILEASDPVTLPDYARAGHFVSFLIERDGLDPLLELATLADYHDGIGHVRAAFEQAYGITLDQALDEYEDYPECSALAWMSREIACSAATAATLSPGPFQEPAEFSMPLECGAEGVLGPIGGFVVADVVLDIQPQFGVLDISITGDLSDEVLVALASCDGGCADATTTWLEPWVTETGVVAPGRYLVRFFRPLDDPGELGLALSQ